MKPLDLSITIQTRLSLRAAHALSDIKAKRGLPNFRAAIEEALIFQAGLIREQESGAKVVLERDDSSTEIDMIDFPATTSPRIS